MILVTGATGTIGRLLVRELSERKVEHRTLVRSAEKGDALGAPYVVGDFDRPETLHAAMADIHAVLLNGPAGEPMVRQQTAVLDAARAAGVRRIVKISSRGADAQSEVPMARAHGVVEQALADSPFEWSVLRPATFMQNLLRNAASVRSEGKIFGAYRDGRISFVDCADIAACAATLLVADGHAGRTYTLSGPEALSFADVATKLSRAIGKSVTYVDLPPDQMVRAMAAGGLPMPFAEQMVRLMVAFASGGGGQVTAAVHEITGRPARSLDAFFEQNASAFR